VSTLAQEVLKAALEYGRARMALIAAASKGTDAISAEMNAELGMRSAALLDVGQRYQATADELGGECPVRGGEHCEHRIDGEGCHACQDPGSVEVNDGRCTSDHFP
jgi:hypothetical protein